MKTIISSLAVCIGLLFTSAAFAVTTTGVLIGEDAAPMGEYNTCLFKLDDGRALGTMATSTTTRCGKYIRFTETDFLDYFMKCNYTLDASKIPVIVYPKDGFTTACYKRINVFQTDNYELVI